MASAWLDERRPGVLFLARSSGRPLWVGRGRDETFFASTREALEIVERYTRMTLTKREVDEGRLVALEHGRVAWTERFVPDRSYHEPPLPHVRAPEEGFASLQRLAAIAAL